MAEGLTISSTSSLSDMSAIVIADAIANVEPAGPTASLVTRYDINQGEKQVNLPLWGRLTAAALTEGVTLQAAQQLTVTVRNLTATEHGILTFVSKVLEQENNENVLGEVGMMQGLAVGRLRELDLVTLFGSVTGIDVPGAGQPLTWRILGGLMAYLRTDNNTSFGPAPGGIFHGVFHPEQIRQLMEEDAGLQAGGAAGAAQGARPGRSPSEEVIENYFRGRPMRFGFNLWESGIIARDGSGDANGGVFAPQAFALAMAKEIEAEDDQDIRSRGTDIVTVARWGESEVVDEWAGQVSSQADVIS